MKLRNLLLGILMTASAASAQDIITRTDGTKVEAKVEEITESVVRYRKAANPTGPIYTIALPSIASIAYENGSIDNFNTSASNALSRQSTQRSDDELIRYADSTDMQTSQQSPGRLSDAELLRYTKPSGHAATLYKKAKTARIIGWTGGILLIGAGIIIPVAKWEGPRDGHRSEFIGVMAGGIVSGVIWCTGFNIWAWSLSKKASEIEWLSSSLFEDEIMHLGGTSLMAGVNLLENRQLHSNAVGLSLKLNF